jgi:hypothetical protein
VFALPHAGHGGATAPALLAPSKELPPFSAETSLVVAAERECVDLRAEPSHESTAGICAESGTVVVPLTPPDGMPAVAVVDGETWLHVAAGERAGWIPSAAVRWA